MAPRQKGQGLESASSFLAHLVQVATWPHGMKAALIARVQHSTHAS